MYGINKGPCSILKELAGIVPELALALTVIGPIPEDNKIASDTKIIAVPNLPKSNNERFIS
jgi:hypothetical protein